MGSKDKSGRETRKPKKGAAKPVVQSTVRPRPAAGPADPGGDAKR